MFLKPFKLRSQTAIKGSDRKKLRAEIGKRFPDFTPEMLTQVVPNKEEMTVMKIYAHSGESVIVYTLLKNPAFFEIEKIVYPTVYTLWKFPDLMPVFTTWPPVFQKFVGGADLMLPGLVVQQPVTPASLGNLSKGQGCAVKLHGNKCPVAVGKTALSSSDMYDSGLRGKGVIVLHTYQDLLWAHGDKTDPPHIEDPGVFQQNADSESDSESDCEADVVGQGGETGEVDGATNNADIAPSGHSAAAAAVAPTSVCIRTLDAETGESECQKRTLQSDRAIAGPTSRSDNGNNMVEDRLKALTLEERPRETVEESNAVLEGAVGGVIEQEPEDDDPRSPQERMDELLYTCFLHALKVNVKKSDLPLLTSKFAKVHMQPCCPHNRSLDVKKSSYKKLSKFLQAMQKEDFIKVKELSKGVESITVVTKDHPVLRAFVVPDLESLPESSTAGTTSSASHYQPPEIIEMFTVSAATLPLFRLAKFQKASALTASEVRRVLTDYVKENELQSERNKGMVTLDPLLSDVLLNRGEYLETMGWEEVFGRCQSKMSLAHRVTFPGHAPQIRKGKLEPIVLSAVQRTGNKKVTLVHNLETYGVDPQQFARDMQTKAASSCSVAPLPGKNRGMEVLVQGNQISLVADVLSEKYGLPKKYMVGLEKAPKGKR